MDERVNIYEDADGVWVRVGGPGESWTQGALVGPYDSMAEARADLAEILTEEVDE